MVQNSAADSSAQPQTHLFTVRLWQASAGSEQSEIRGKVQHVLNGEVRYFSDWRTLQDFLMQQLRQEDEPANE